MSCAIVRGPDHLAKEKCSSRTPCGVCNHDTAKRLVLKGLCFQELQEGGDFDTEYYAHGLINGRMHFRCV